LFRKAGYWVGQYAWACRFQVCRLGKLCLHEDRECAVLRPRGQAPLEVTLAEARKVERDLGARVCRRCGLMR
jgi:hypothetical protein